MSTGLSGVVDTNVNDEQSKASPSTHPSCNIEISQKEVVGQQPKVCNLLNETKSMTDGSKFPLKVCCIIIFSWIDLRFSKMRTLFSPFL